MKKVELKKEPRGLRFSLFTSIVIKIKIYSSNRLAGPTTAQDAKMLAPVSYMLSGNGLTNGHYKSKKKPNIVFLHWFVQKIHAEKHSDIFKPVGNMDDLINSL